MGFASPRFRSVTAILALALVVSGFFRLKAEATELEGSFRLPASHESRSFRLTAFAKAAVVKQAEGHLKVSGTRFLNPDGSVFQWRGISAFRLLELVAHGREAEAEAYLKWAASKQLTVVRVPGKHMDIMEPPNVGVLASHVRAHIAAARARVKLRE